MESEQGEAMRLGCSCDIDKERRREVVWKCPRPLCSLRKVGKGHGEVLKPESWSVQSPVSQWRACLRIPAPRKAANGKPSLHTNMAMDLRAQLLGPQIPCSWTFARIFCVFSKHCLKKKTAKIGDGIILKIKYFIHFLGKILNLFWVMGPIQHLISAVDSSLTPWPPLSFLHPQLSCSWAPNICCCSPSTASHVLTPGSLLPLLVLLLRFMVLQLQAHFCLKDTLAKSVYVLPFRASVVHFQVSELSLNPHWVLIPRLPEGWDYFY